MPFNFEIPVNSGFWALLGFIGLWIIRTFHISGKVERIDQKVDDYAHSTTESFRRIETDIREIRDILRPE